MTYEHKALITIALLILGGLSYGLLQALSASFEVLVYTAAIMAFFWLLGWRRRDGRWEWMGFD